MGRIAWVIAGVATLAFCVTFSELQRMRTRFGDATQHKFHDHQDARRSMIKAQLAGLDHPIVILGDSITEMARFPDSADGYPIVNAGIGGDTIRDFVGLAPDLLEGITPAAIVVALGANDIGSPDIRAEYSALLSNLKNLAPTVIAVAVTPMDGAEAVNSEIAAAATSEGIRLIETHTERPSSPTDHIHPNPAESKKWATAIVAELPAPRS
jgi:lysophospholipase L1-like esterase